MCEGRDEVAPFSVGEGQRHHSCGDHPIVALHAQGGTGFNFPANEAECDRSESRGHCAAPDRADDFGLGVDQFGSRWRGNRGIEPQAP